MNQNNLILQAIYDYLRGLGRSAAIYWSFRVGDPPVVSGVPCVSLRLASGGVLAIQVSGTQVNIYDSLTTERRTLDTNYPDLFDILEAYPEQP